MATPPGIQALESAAHRYLTDENFGVVEIDTVMSKVFRDNPDGAEALAWAAFWTQLNIYEEKVRGGEEAGEAPKVSSDLLSCTTHSYWILLGRLRVLLAFQSHHRHLRHHPKAWM
jgi:hypothetical protein